MCEIENGILVVFTQKPRPSEEMNKGAGELDCVAVPPAPKERFMNHVNGCIPRPIPGS